MQGTARREKRRCGERRDKEEKDGENHCPGASY